MLSVRDLNKKYISGGGTLHALKNVSVEIEKGEIFGFIGLSGAGKTSLARCISMLEIPDSGDIVLNGVDISKLRGGELRETRKKMGLVFQHFNLLMNKNVYDNVAFPLKIAKTPKDEIEKRVSELLELTGLTSKKDSYPSELSGGQKQRVGIARALAAEPELVICDEATSALDPETTKSVLELIKRINERTGVTFIMITHEMDVIKELCGRVAVMEDGGIIELGSVVDVLTAPKTKTAARFFGGNEARLDVSKLGGAVTKENRIIRATFVGESALRPFISDVIRKFDIELSILSGKIESVGDTMVGTLNIRLSGAEDAVASSIQYFKDGNVLIEEAGNV